MSNAKKILYIAAACLILGCFFALLLVPFASSGQVLDQARVITQTGQTLDVQFPHLQPPSTDHPVTFQFHIAANQGDTLVIRRPSGNALEVLLNGSLIYRLGEMEVPTANIWNSILAVPLLGDLHEDNLLEIRLIGNSYGIGLSVPPYIETYAIANNRVDLARFLYHDLLYISLGAALLVGLILIVLSVARSPKFGAEFYLGLACILAAVFCLDYVFRLTTGSLTAFLWFKKILMSAGYLSTLSFVIGLEKYSIRRIWVGRLLLLPTLISVCLMVTASNMAMLVRMLPPLNIVLLINMAAVVVIMIRRQQYRPWLIIPAVFLTLSLLQLVVLTALNLSLPFVLQYVILTTALILGISMITEYNQLLRENSELEQKANRDPLTGVYNRNILRRISLHPHDVVVVMDLDSLKKYNDRFGHPEGDKLLMSLTETINLNLRQSDMVIRYGGDEFILILRDASVEASERVVQRINKQFSELTSANWASFSYGIEAMGETLAQTLALADESMYEMKKSRKAEPA